VSAQRSNTGVSRPGVLPASREPTSALRSLNAPASDPLNVFDPRTAHPARVYNVWLGGKDHFESDRKVASRVITQRPQVVDSAVANRRFLGRAVQHLARCYGVRQFVDIGTGLPAPGNTHEVAQQVDPWSRVLYIDNDPLVMSHARALLTSTEEGCCAYLHADLRDTACILREARRTLDFSRPIAVLLLAVLHFIDDADDPAGIVAALAGALTAGSSVVISHLTADSAPEAVGGGVAAYNALVPSPVVARTHAQVTELFGDLQLVPPGVVPVSEWRPDTVAEKVTDVYAGIGRKPQRKWW
jgi:S-adenosyl methyltransferase